jgi:predicted Zn-dependent protease
MTAGPARDERVGGLVGAAAEFRVVSEGQTISGTAYFIEHRGRVFRVMGYAPDVAWTTRQPVVRAAILSFRPETDAAVLNALPQRIRLVRTTAAMTLPQFQQRYPQASIDELAILNALAPGANIPSGTLMKRVEGAPVP